MKTLSSRLPVFRVYGKKLFSKLTHTGPSKMVNIGEKQPSLRYAKAQAIVKCTNEIILEVKNNNISKGDVLKTAEIAGIMASKKTSELIPLCHQIPLNTTNINIEMTDDSFVVTSYVEAYNKTGVEIEAMLSCNVAALTIYDMCKAMDKSITIIEVKLLEKYGGKSGHYKI